MKCNICGADMEPGDLICKICGNEIEITPEKKLSSYTELDDTKVLNKIPLKEYRSVNYEGYKPQKENRNESYVDKNAVKAAKFCTKCGRPLDGVTHRCVVCDAQRVSVSHNIKRDSDVMSSKRRKKKKNPAGLIVLVSLGVVIIFAAAVFLGRAFIGENPEETEAPALMTDEPQKTESAAVIITEPPTERPTAKATEKPTAKPTSKPTEKPAPTDEPITGDPAKKYGGSYAFPSHNDVISVSELENMDDGEIRIVYFEMYARYNMSFDADDLIGYFENQKWYRPTEQKNLRMIQESFNSVEKQNRKIILNYVDENNIDCLERY